MKKRILSALLSVCMLLTLFFTPALAAEEAAEPTVKVTLNEDAESVQELEEQTVVTDEDAGLLDELPLGAEGEPGLMEELPVFADEADVPADAIAEDAPLGDGPEDVSAQLSAEPEWVSGMVLKGYDLFTKDPSKLPDTAAEGKYLVLAQSGVEGDTAVYALYLNSASCQPNNGVVAGQGVVAARLARENGELVGYLAGSNTKVTLEQMLITIKASGGDFTFSNSGKYLAFSGGSMVSSSSTTTSVSSREGVNGAYLLVGGNRKLTLYVADQHHYNDSWQTNFWGPQGDMGQGAAGSQGSSYIYFFYPHVDDGKVVTAAKADGTAIEANADGDFVIPTGGTIRVDGQVTFTVPAVVARVTVATNYASSLVMNENGGFGVMGCTITMQDGTTTSQIARSGNAGGSVTFARTADNRLYFGGTGSIRDVSGTNTEVAPWLDTVGDRTLKSVSIGAGVTAVGANAFKFTNVTRLTLPEGLERIGESAFEGTKVESVEFPDSLTEIGDNAFRGVTGLRSVTLPTGLTTLGTGAFSGCTRLRDVIVAGDDLSGIPAGAFQAISHHSKLNVVFQGTAPVSAYSDFDCVMPFLHQDGAIVYTQTAPAPALARSSGKDAFFANVNGGDLTGVTLQGGVLPVLPPKGGEAFTGWQVGTTEAALPGGSAVKGQPSGTVFTAQWGGAFTVACTVTIDGVGYTVAQGGTMGSNMPTDPVREGYRFAGWKDATTGADFTADTVVMSDMVIRADWTELPHYTVRFDANGGTLQGQTTVTVAVDGTLGAKMPADPVREGYLFAGWTDATGAAFTADTAVTGDMVIRANWTEAAVRYTVRFDANGGVLSGKDALTVAAGEKLPLLKLPTVSRAGYTFDGWFTSSGARFVLTAPITADLTLTAKWTEEGKQPAQPTEPSGGGSSSGGSSSGDGSTGGGSTGGGSSSGGSTTPAPKPSDEDLKEPDVPKTDAPKSFVDVAQNAWYAKAVAAVAAKGVMKGVGEDRFAPEATLSRGMMAQILYNMEGGPAVSVKAAFADVKAGAWYGDAVAWGVDKGILKGISDTAFGGEGDLSREQMAVMLYRYAQKAGLDTAADRKTLEKFNDRETASDWAVEAMAWCVEKGLLKGRGGETLAPQATITRAEAATILQRYAETFPA